MIIPYDLIIIAAVMGAVFFRIAEAEQRSVLLWPLYSVGLVIVGKMVLHWGYLGIFALQVLLFAAMFVANLINDPKAAS